MMSGAVFKPRVLSFLVFLFAIIVCDAETVRDSTRAMEAEHLRGVELGRAGKYDDALAILDRLLQVSPDNYPLLRDSILINAWKGDCREALARFERIRARPRLDGYLVGPVADCAVQRARTGDYDAGLDVLKALLPHAKDSYPLQRDITLITIWKGDCKAALDRFDPMRNDVRNPPYLIVPAADCLLEENRPFEALALIEAGLERYPGEATLLHAHTKAEVSLRVDENLDEDRPAAKLGFVLDSSDRDVREWFLRAEASAAIAKRARVYARYLLSRSDQAELDPGDMNRAGIGVRWRPNARFFIEQEFSKDTRQSSRGGSHTLLTYKPYDAWTMTLEHDTYAEDISVRARAAGIEANRSEAALEYSSPDYIWYWRASADRHDYSDTNRRNSLFTTLGYAYQMLPEREHRVYVEWYRSHNTLDNAVYFNPKSDESVGLVHRTDFIYDTRFKRHVDRLFFTLNSYQQESFGTHGKWGIRYEQDYDFDNSNALVVGAAFDRNVYDGLREDEWRFELLYSKRF